MTPEERLNNLKKADRWTVNSIEPRTDVVPTRVRPTRLLVPAIAGLVAVAVAGALVVGAVTLRSNRAEPALPTPTSSSSTPTPTGTPTASSAAPGTTGYQQPAQPFGGQCASVASVADLTTAAGSPVTTGSYDGETPYTSLIDTTVDATWRFAAVQNGGLSCSWHDSADLLVIVTVFPAAAVSELAPSTCEPTPQSEGGDTSINCAFVHTSDGLTFTGAVYTPKRTTSLAFANKLFALLDGAAAQATVPAVTTDAASWQLGVDCPTVSIADVGGTSWSFAQSQIGTEGGASAVVSTLMNGRDWLYCTTTAAHPAAGTPKSVQYAVYGGGAWVFDREVAAGATVTDVPGFDHAAIEPTSDGAPGGFLLLTRGPNLLSAALDGQDASSIAAVSKAVADGLDALR